MNPQGAKAPPDQTTTEVGRNAASEISESPAREDLAGTPRSSVDEHAAYEIHEPRNLIALAFHQVVLRIGWVFKTETVIMPAFLDSVSGAGWMRGLLPVINRVGQSVPPAIFSRQLKVMRHKKLGLVSCTFLLAIPFVVLAVGCSVSGYRDQWWMAPLFLAMYGMFFTINGLNNLSYDTVQGKLIRPARRGRLVVLSVGIGSIPAVLAAWWWLGAWLAWPDGSGYAAIYGFIACCFVAAGFIALAVREPPDAHALTRDSVSQHFAGSWHILRRDANFRRLVVATVLFATVLLLFPHYQALGRERFGLGGARMMTWVVMQNISLGLASLIAGTFADRLGNRLVLRCLFFAAALTPIFAVVLTQVDPDIGRHAFPVIFVLLGMTPVTQRTLINYTLEISPTAEHPRYLSTLSVCAAAPILFAPLAGWLIDRTSFELIFTLGAVLIASSGLLTFSLIEPRHGLR